MNERKKVDEWMTSFKLVNGWVSELLSKLSYFKYGSCAQIFLSLSFLQYKCTTKSANKAVVVEEIIWWTNKGVNEIECMNDTV